MAEKLKIEHGSVQETLIIPLYARKLCSEKFPSLYTDPLSETACERIDYDFSDIETKGDSTAYQFGALEGAMRQLDMMWEVNDYISKHPKASIVALGCGLDQDPRRCGTSDNKIYNIDFPDTIAAREEIVGVDPRETNISCDLNDHRWMDEVDASGGAVLYASGVFYYLKTEDVRNLILAIADRFPGSRLLFDSVGELGFSLMKKMIFRNFGTGDMKAYFHTGNAKKDLADWTDRAVISTRKYMRGYYDMRTPGIKGVHRFLADIADNIMHMEIVRIDMK